MATLQEFNAKMKIDSESEDNKDDEMLMCFNYDKRLSYSLFAFSEKNLLRRFCKKLTGNKYLFKSNYNWFLELIKYGTKFLGTKIKNTWHITTFRFIFSHYLIFG